MISKPNFLKYAYYFNQISKNIPLAWELELHFVLLLWLLLFRSSGKGFKKQVTIVLILKKLSRNREISRKWEKISQQLPSNLNIKKQGLGSSHQQTSREVACLPAWEPPPTGFCSQKTHSAAQVMDIRLVSNALTTFQQPISHTGLPCSALLQGEELIHTST